MIKTETRMISQEEKVYYCDSCGNKLGINGNLKSGYELKAMINYVDEKGFSYGEYETSYHLCWCCFNALDRHLNKRPKDKEKSLVKVLK